MHRAKKIEINSFDPNELIARLGGTDVAKYLACYLYDLNVCTIIEEPQYFDRDYLAEFEAFYCTSSRGYPNTCARLHFFAGSSVDRSLLFAAIGGQQAACKAVQERYVGFSVLRPFSPPLVGRTVVRWYPDVPSDGCGHRVMESARDYFVTLAGLRLSVRGLAWQQQDGNVGSCATVALWSMLHSSALDDTHAIPTTSEITIAATRRGNLGGRVFPSDGLLNSQICEAIQELRLSPILLDGDIEYDDGTRRFSQERFSASCAAFLRSGYPVLVTAYGAKTNLGHAVCMTGFRPRSDRVTPAGSYVMADGDTAHFYIHDDNLGPNVRFVPESSTDDSGDIYVQLAPSPPTSSEARAIALEDPTSEYEALIPDSILVAVHNDVKITPDMLHATGMELAAVASVSSKDRGGTAGLRLSTRFISVRDYMDIELNKLLGHNAQALGLVRLQLAEKVPPMSLHLGLIRIGSGASPILDIVYDTTGGLHELRAFAHVLFQKDQARWVLEAAERLRHDLGVSVDPTDQNALNP